MGRDVDNFDTSELLAVYSGAQIKNFDTYINSPSSFEKSQIWGEQSFFRLYKDLGSKKAHYIGPYQGRLGNVYTQFYSFYFDWGFLGVIIMSFVISAISMFVYNKAWDSIAVSKPFFKIYVFVYSSIALSIFMSFYSSRFTETFFRIQFLKNLIYLIVFIRLFNFILLGNCRTISRK